MNENNYLIQFDYAGEVHSIHNLSHCDFSKGDSGDKLWIADMIELYIKANNMHKDGAKATNVRLFGKEGELIAHISDFEQEFRI